MRGDATIEWRVESVISKISLVLLAMRNTLVGFWMIAPRLARRFNGSETFVVKIEPHHLDRYLLKFVQDYRQDGPICILLNRRLVTQIGSLRNQPHLKYGKLLVQSTLISFSFGSKRANAITILDDYWGAHPDVRWPLGVHPNYVNFEFKVEREINSIAFVGNCADYYKTKFDSDLWGMPDRLAQVDFLKNEVKSVKISTLIPLGEYVKVLRSCDFFICLPGVTWPMCHNSYEAIKNGAIPILHANYLSLFPTEIQAALKQYSYLSLGDLKSLCDKICSGENLQERNRVRTVLENWNESGFGVEQIGGASLRGGTLFLLNKKSMEYL
ncbi:hypothetical protein N9L83_02810 [Flavobacteriales bacterium]|nr:hypothetical protein [Flavobacteriales bacterium]